jgi:preprotein translocase subunit SecD|tara:strand:- start:1479 stop:3338 length:1860 start_codon:yes stop_codon:yes gene_type:complete
MLNKYPWWKNLLIVLIVTFGVIYALPNVYAPDPAIQIAPESSSDVVDEATLRRVQKALNDAGLEYFGDSLDGRRISVRLNSQEDQLKAKTAIENTIGDGFIVALNLAATTPKWLADLGGSPMKLGLDLSGGVHFLLEVDTESAINKKYENAVNDMRRAMREARVRSQINLTDRVILASFSSDEVRDQGIAVIRETFADLQRSSSEDNGRFIVSLTMTSAQTREIEKYAVTQNLTTLRNRVNELGVAEPLVQQQGANRIVVELPGIQDTAAAKKILGKTASLEFRLEADFEDPSYSREEFGYLSDGFGTRDDWLEKKIIITGENVSNANAGYDENSMPQVSISLDSQGGAVMHRATRNNINRSLGVLFIERKSRTVGFEIDESGNRVPVREKYDSKKIISLATIRAALGSQFRITGLNNAQEASELALLLRAGALAAPIDFVEERTIGPSLGAENISLGVLSVQIGLGLVLLFMLLFYKAFGLAANIALAVNLGLLLACMSILSATLTMPGIAGIVLTVGMAVDANVLIFSRIKEELANRMSPQQAINAGFDRAFVTILDANITTLIVAVLLYAVGTGPIKGFAVTLSIGILTSMFTAIIGTRAIVNLMYGGRNVKKLWI